MSEEGFETWGFRPTPTQCVTGVSVYRYRTISPVRVDVQVCIDHQCAYGATFEGMLPVKRALAWAEKEFPGQKIEVNV